MNFIEEEGTWDCEEWGSCVSVSKALENWWPFTKTILELIVNVLKRCYRTPRNYTYHHVHPTHTRVSRELEEKRIG